MPNEPINPATIRKRGSIFLSAAEAAVLRQFLANELDKLRLTADSSPHSFLENVLNRTAKMADRVCDMFQGSEQWIEPIDARKEEASNGTD